MSKVPACPRCGYDQSGLIATWEQSCPLEGVCSECGLEMLWAEVLSPKFAPPAWSFEHTRRMGVLPLIETLGRVCVPGSFWRQMRLTHPVVIRRLLVLILVLIAIGHLAAAGAGAAVAYRVAASAPPTPAWIRFPPPGGGGPARRRPPAPTGPDPREVAIQAALWPYGMDRLWVLMPRFMTRQGAVIHDPAYELLVFAIAIPPGFLILGDTMRQCKVLKRHLLRGAAYSLTGPLLVWLAGVSIAATGGYVPWRLGFVIGAVWLIVYWTVFVRGYLRLTHATGVILAMLTMAGLLTAIVVTVNFTRHLRW